MQYAIFGDIHSSAKDLRFVMEQVAEQAPTASLICTGDVFECTISKKDVKGQLYDSIYDVVKSSTLFEAMTTFPSVAGNQEERMMLLTATEEPLRKRLANYPDRMVIEGAGVIHGHQWQWGGTPWSLQRAEAVHRLTFYGHSHEAMWSIEGVKQTCEKGVIYKLPTTGEILVNVGPVIGKREWVLYNSEEQTIQFF